MNSASCRFFSPGLESELIPRPSALLVLSNASKSNTLKIYSSFYENIVLLTYPKKSLLYVEYHLLKVSAELWTKMTSYISFSVSPTLLTLVGRWKQQSFTPDSSCSVIAHQYLLTLCRVTLSCTLEACMFEIMLIHMCIFVFSESWLKVSI